MDIECTVRKQDLRSIGPVINKFAIRSKEDWLFTIEYIASNYIASDYCIEVIVWGL